MSLTRTFAFLGLLIISSGAYAACWGEGTHTTEIYRVRALVMTADDDHNADVVYSIFVRGEVCETGRAGIVDERKCEGRPYERRLVRVMQWVDSSGRNAGEISRSEIQTAVAPAAEAKPGPCTRFATDATNDLFNVQTGNASNWQNAISRDLQNALDELGTYGNVRSTTIVFQRGPRVATDSPGGSRQATDSGCQGNACDDVVFRFENGCYSATNAGTRRIRVTMGPYGFIVQRGETHVLRLNGSCPGSYFGGDTANYVTSN